MSDEIAFWNEKSQSLSSKSEREGAKIFADLLRKINDLMLNVESFEYPGEFFDELHTALDSLWQSSHNYPQNRMTDLLDIICE